MQQTLASRPFSAFSVIISFVTLAIIGAFCIPFMDLQLMPSASAPRLSITYNWPNASAKAIEQEITSPMEGFFSEISGLKQIRSLSSKGKGEIFLSFDKNKNMDIARFEASMLIRELFPQLPSDITYPQLSLNATGEKSAPILNYSLTGNAPPDKIKQWLDKNILPGISQIPGVQAVSVHGNRPVQWEIIYHTDLLNRLGITVETIETSIQNYVHRYDVGKMEVDHEPASHTLEVTMQAPFYSKTQIGEIPVNKVGSRVIFLKDIAKFAKKSRPLNQYYRINGQNTLNIAVYKASTANTLTVAKQVKRELAKRSAIFPEGYSLQKTKDTSIHLQKELRKLGLRALLSVFLLLILTFLFYRKLTFLLALLISLMVNLLMAFAAFYVFGVEIHLYSLAGITISFGIILDNSILMLAAIAGQKSRKTFRAILSATLTTMGAIIVIFFLDDQQQVNLIDFAKVIVINLSLSLLIAYFLIPALAKKINLYPGHERKHTKPLRRATRGIHQYMNFLLGIARYKWILAFIMIIAFGLPLDHLPEHIESEHFTAKLYNRVFGNDSFRNKVKPILVKALGGSYQLFKHEVFENSYEAGTGERLQLLVTAEMEQGSTIQQLNETIRQMEEHIKQYEEIELFETNITNYDDASIAIFFKPSHEQNLTPFLIKRKIEEKALQLGGASWYVVGVGRGFTNHQSSHYRNSTIVMKGYHYDQLYQYAQLLSNELMNNSRIKDVGIINGWSSLKNPDNEYHLNINTDHPYHGLSRKELYDGLLTQTQVRQIATIKDREQVLPIILKSDKVGKFNVWDTQNEPFTVQNKTWKAGSTFQLEKRKTGNKIFKNNQEYQLSVSYNFLGPPMLISKWQERYVEFISQLLPIGFNATKSQDSWRKDNPQQYLYIGLVALIIFIICTISLESLKQSFLILTLIPLSFIGIFLTFYLFEVNFDQGGYASFLLTGGLSVNAGLYLVNDFNYLTATRRFSSPMAFKKAFAQKIIPIAITLLSTICGLIPFLIQAGGEPFWYAFAAGSIGGLICSTLGFLVYLPAFLIRQ